MSGKHYEVGYGKPPQETRFKSGQSGNPKGRPKGSKNLKTVVQQEMNALIAINEGGRQRRVSRREALIKMLLNKGLKGDFKASTAVIQLDRLIDQDIAPILENGSPSVEDQAILEDFRLRLISASPTKPDPESGEKQ